MRRVEGANPSVTRTSRNRKRERWPLSEERIKAETLSAEVFRHDWQGLKSAGLKYSNLRSRGSFSSLMD